MVFTNVVKPTHVCNLDCVYCYNEDERKPRMSAALAARVVDETISFAASERPDCEVDFIWHGGEPLVVGKEFYRDVVATQSRCLAKFPNTRVENTVQTNGTLIDEEWVDLFAENNFRVSISIDGPKEINDRTRISKNKSGSFDRILAGIEHLRRKAIPFGVCVVLSKRNIEDVDLIYDFLAKNRLPFNVIPLNRSGAGLSNYVDVGLDELEYAEPWIRLFDRWFYAASDDYVFASDFVHKSRAILSGEPSDCIGQENCSRYHVSTDPEGRVYPCATLSADSDWCYGNLGDQSMAELLSSDVAVRALRRREDPHCTRCKWRHVCHGGCMSRAVKFFGTHDSRDFYCGSLYRIYEHVAARLREETVFDLTKVPDVNHVDSRNADLNRPLKHRDLVQIAR